jgi:hypothetical protein
VVDFVAGGKSMALSFLSKLSKDEQQELMDDLNYLNISEIKSLCSHHSIPYRIAIETEDGGRRVTKDDDRKGVILHRIRHFLRTGVILQETRFQASVVCFDRLSDNITADNRLFYGQYDKTNRTMIALLKNLTDGQFENGAIARILAREFWSSGKAPTFREFASAWTLTSKEHLRPKPEWAFLSDRASKMAVPNWKKLRSRKASRVLKLLNQITSK